MRKVFLSFLLLTILNQVFAQVDPVGNFNRHIAANWVGEYIRISQYRVKGTPYLLGESFAGVITYKSGKASANNKILYDLYNQKAGIDMNNEIYVADDPIDQFIIDLPEKFGGQKLLFKNANHYGNTEVKGYLNVLQDGSKVTFLKAYKIKLVADPTNTLVKDVKVFEQYYEYYLYNKSSQQLQKIKLKEKDVIKELDDAEFVKNYKASNGTADLSKEAGLIQLIKYYNNL
jgi:hypothetical protein